MSRLNYALFLIAGFTLFAFQVSVPLRAQTPKKAEKLEVAPHPKGYVCYQTSEALTIDGQLNEPAWAKVPWSDPFEDIEGNKRPKPRFQTRMKMLWDQEALYIAAELEEPHIWGTLKNHDAVIFMDPDFEVFLDPDGDNHVYGELELNALNTTWDLLLTKPYKDSGKAINAWEIAGLKSAVHIQGTLNNPSDVDKCWSLEIRWPLANIMELMRKPALPKNGDQWRINFSRVEWDVDIVEGKYQKVKGRPEHNWVWSPQGVIDMHRPERWGYLQFSTDQPGTTEFRKDPDWSIREQMHRVYYAQLSYKQRHLKYAKALSELGLEEITHPLKLETTQSKFQLSLETRDANKKPRRYSLHSDSQFIEE